MRRFHAVAGMLGAGMSLAASELAAGLVSPLPSLVEEVGDVVVDNAPTAVKDWAIATFGTYDKPVLLAGIVVVSLVLGALVGVASVSRRWLATLVFWGFGALGAAAAIVEGVSPVAAVAAGVLAAVVGWAVHSWLARRAEPIREGDEFDASRRAFLAGAGAVIAVAALSAGAGRLLVDRARRIVAGRESVRLPVAASPAPTPPANASFSVAGLSPLVTPNEDFYRIDTALSIPRVDLPSWSLRITGMVDRPYELTFDDLLEMDLVERYVTLSCVSNEVGGNLVGNAAWLGVPLAEVLDRAGVRQGASQIVGRSVDGFTVGFPTDVVYDGRESLVAVGMNGEPLPLEHGFPARLVVAGLYGYVSATKWLSEIELTTWEAFDAYWVPRGWAKEGPVRTQSRIDTPRAGDRLTPGERAIAGVAWAPNVGIERVEVQVNDEPWVEAELAEPLGEDAWRQWRFRWEAQPGHHVIKVRATDRNGVTQTEDRAPPAPDGATGWHTIRVRVEA
ncbi:MAG TPA: molybdopterin-dependent oxidoreductase [Acidimicrobiia bacterium]|jgi:DMSO/TMAO reductase YedYZ molybdopterin-dependent catalytic subunit